MAAYLIWCRLLPAPRCRLPSNFYEPHGGVWPLGGVEDMDIRAAKIARFKKGEIDNGLVMCGMIYLLYF